MRSSTHGVSLLIGRAEVSDESEVGGGEDVAAEAAYLPEELGDPVIE